MTEILVPKPRRLTKAMTAFLSVVISLVIFSALAFIFLEWQLPDVSKLKDMHMQVPLRVLSAEGQLIAQYGTKRRIPVSLNAIPEQLIQAVLAVEDARYYQHPGVDIIGIIRAAKAVILSGHKVQGASTITMQVARNFFLTDKKTYSRKIKEILLALKIDKVLSKNKVLELYLNKVYFGNRAYGVAAAAQAYYGKKLNQLTLAQMAMLAGLPQAPSKNNPIANPKAALMRRNHVLARMLDVGFIDKSTCQQAMTQAVSAKYHGQHIALHAPYIAELVRQVMVKHYGSDAYDRGYTVTTTVHANLQHAAQQALEQGLINYSRRHGFREITQNLGAPTADNAAQWQQTLGDMPSYNLLQNAAVLTVNAQSIDVLIANGAIITIPWSGLQWAGKALTNGLVGAKPKAASDIVKPGDVVWLEHVKEQWSLAQLPLAQGALVSLNPNDGAIVALVGGYDFSLSKFNRANQASRQAGSSFKPFVYSAALAKGFTLASIINDAPVVMQDTGENSLWRPRNDTLKFYGPTRLLVGLTKSRNLVSIRLLQDIGIQYTLDYLTRFGFDKNTLPQSLSLALGSASITPLHVASSYAVFANGGYRVSPHFITKITDETNNVVYAPSYPMACETCISNPHLDSTVMPDNIAPKVLTPQNAYLMTQAMRGVISSGTGRAARVLKRNDLAGKTGTTNNQADAWFSGFNSNVLATVWVGFDDLASLHEYGAQAALPIWIQYMRAATKASALATMPMPAGIVMARIAPSDGLLAPVDQRNAIFEVFRKSHEPTTYTAELQAPLDNSAAVTNKTADDSNAPLF